MSKLPGKTNRRLLAAIEAAGGQLVRVTDKGHLQVRGPQGVAVVGGHEITSTRDRLNTTKCLSRYAGLQVRF